MKQKTAIIHFLCLFTSFTMLAQEQGLTGDYYNGKNFNQKIMTRTDRQINFVWDNVAPASGIDAQDFSVRWTGQIKAPKSGEYMFRAKVDDGIRVRVGGQLVISAWGMNDEGKFMGYITLREGQLYNLEVEYFNGLLEGEVQLFWQLPGEEPMFGGALGYNDKMIESKYFFKPVVINTPPVEKPQPVAPPKPAPKKETKPAKPITKPAEKPKPVVAAPISKDSIEKFTPKNILFEKSKTIMLAGSTAELDRLAGFLVRHPKIKLTIEGHTDNVGDSAKNLELSQKRADTVSGYLQTKGVANHRITSIGYGDTRPLIKSDKGNEKNRRVVFLME